MSNLTPYICCQDASRAIAFYREAFGAIGGTPVKLHLYVDDVDAVIARAVAAGATVVRPATDEFYGDRAGQIQDPSGHVWFVATRKEQLAAAEIRRRYDEMMRG
jgi:PhnB protein